MAIPRILVTCVNDRASKILHSLRQLTFAIINLANRSKYLYAWPFSVDVYNVNGTIAVPGCFRNVLKFARTRMTQYSEYATSIALNMMQIQEIIANIFKCWRTSLREYLKGSSFLSCRHV